MWNPEGEYCVHGFEAFPGWHRAYLLEFERTLRRADMALGGDGMIGLPYWGWEEANINGEVFPKILRERFEKYPVSTLVPPQHRTCLLAAQKLSLRSSLSLCSTQATCRCLCFKSFERLLVIAQDDMFPVGIGVTTQAICRCDACDRRVLFLTD